MKDYVLGFIIDTRLEKVLLVKKNRPDYLKGKLIGIGGKIEDLEKPIDAMIRECREETGLEIKDWVHFCNFACVTKTYTVYSYYAITDDVFNYKQIEDEILGLYSINPFMGIPQTDYYRYYERDNFIDWLLEMALNHIVGKQKVFLNIEYTPE